jgi:hypothetical protein
MAGNEQSDTDADPTHSKMGTRRDNGGNGGNGSWDTDVEKNQRVTDSESEITFLNLKLKLLSKESNQEYDEVQYCK